MPPHKEGGLNQNYIIMSVSELLILDKVFQGYLENNDNDEEARDLYNKLLYPLEYEIIKRK